MANPAQEKKPAKSDRICHVNTRDRPFYRFEFGSAFVHYVESLGGIFASLVASCIATLVLPKPKDEVIVILTIVLAIAFVLGYTLTRMLFFVKREVSIKASLHCTVIAGGQFIGIALLCGWIQIDGTDMRWPGFGIIAATWAILATFYRKYGKIGLFTDGMKIGSKVFRYTDIVAVGHGTGSSLDGNIPAEGRGKPIKILTPLEFEYIEKDFGIFHVYLVIVTADAVYIAQSINKQSNMAQDTRNAWSRCVLGHE